MRTLASQLVAHVGAVATLLVLLHTGALRADENGTTRRETRPETVRVAAVQAKPRMVDWRLKDKAEVLAAVVEIPGRKRLDIERGRPIREITA